LYFKTFLFLIFFLNFSNSNSSEIVISDKKICSLSTTRSLTFGRTWVAIDGINGKYVKEAFLRGLFCNTYNKISNKNICEIFSNSEKQLNEFEKIKWYRELSRRNLTCGKKGVNNYSSKFWNKNLKVHKKEIENSIKSDLIKPKIQIDYITTKNKLGIVRGRALDNLGIKYIKIDDEEIFFDKNGKFEYSTFVPIGGLKLMIIAEDSAGLKTVKEVKFKRIKSNKTFFNNFSRLNPLNKKVFKNPDAIAILIGVAKYKNTIADAIFADNDASMFKDYASEKLGVSENRIKVLLNHDASEQEILLAVKEWLRRFSKPNKSDVFIFFAGHGLASDDGKNMYLLPHDGTPKLLDDTAINRTRLFNEIKLAKPRQVIVFLDTCYSGKARDNNSLIEGRPILVKAQKKLLPKNFIVFTAASSEQLSKPLNETKHGMFSYFLMKGMEGDADSNNDKNITAGELHNFVKTNVIQQSAGSQTPELQGDKNSLLVKFY